MLLVSLDGLDRQPHPNLEDVMDRIQMVGDFFLAECLEPDSRHGYTYQVRKTFQGRAIFSNSDREKCINYIKSIS